MGLSSHIVDAVQEPSEAIFSPAVVVITGKKNAYRAGGMSGLISVFALLERRASGGYAVKGVRLA